MSPPPIRLSPDLTRLVDEGYDVDVVAGHLVIRRVPYVDRYRRVRRGMLVCRLDLAGDRTVPPTDHFADFAGALPCDASGRPLAGMVHADRARELGGGLKVDHWLCSRPRGREYVDYHEKVTTFVAQISTPAAALDPTASARVGRLVGEREDRSPFCYADTASARSGTGALVERIAGQNVGIVGLGGTGGYVLDLVSKTPVGRIHLYDEGEFLQHSAFRAPGAASAAELAGRPRKVDYFDRRYSAMHKGIVPHAVRIGTSNLDLLHGLDFVFLCLDDAGSKAPIVERLEARGTAFIDVGMGLAATEAGLVGTVRVTTSTPAMRDHVWDRRRIPFMSEPHADPYATSIQVADLNAVNAALAVIRWKRLAGFYVDLAGEHFSAYSIDGNVLVNEELIT